LYRIAANAIADRHRAQKSWVELHDEFLRTQARAQLYGGLAACLNHFIADLPETYGQPHIVGTGGPGPERSCEMPGHFLSGNQSSAQRSCQRLLDCCDIEISEAALPATSRAPRTGMAFAIDCRSAS
jgi:hypothetical protein